MPITVKDRSLAPLPRAKDRLASPSNTSTKLIHFVNAVVLFWLDMRIACTEALIPSNPAMIEEIARLQALKPALL